MVAALFLAVMIPEAGSAQSPEPAVVEGAVQQRLILDEAFLKSPPAITINVIVETGKGKSSASYTGVLLWSLLEKAGLVDEPRKNANLKHTLLITGRDGYAVALTIGELDPHYEGKSVILACAGGDPPASAVQLRLVVPGDAHGGRSVRDVAAIEVR
jgi:hypothetical protein